MQQQLEATKAEKEIVLAKAKQAVDELTAQLAKTRSAREKDLVRKMSKQEEVINNFKQQQKIDLEVKNFLAERVQQLEQPDGFTLELATLQGQVAMLKGDNVDLEESAAKAAKQASVLRHQVW